MRGEEKVYVSNDEKLSTEARKRLSKLFKMTNKENEQEVAELNKEVEEFYGEYENRQEQVKAAYSSAGDKYRITLINFSSVRNWFKPSEAPTSYKGKSILLVPCKWHCRVSDIDLETLTWNKDVEYTTSQNEVRQFKKGEKVGTLLRGWTSALLKMEPEERASTLERLEIWGQPRAWTDELISVWVVEFIKREHGKALVFADCLASQWTQAVLLKAWLEGILWAPYAPEVTSWLQEPDTHEHAPLKAMIRAVKQEVHWALEQEWLRESKKVDKNTLRPPTSWGPFECLYVVAEAYKRFQEKFKGKVPLEGLQANQMLRVRPNENNELELVRGDEAWSFSTLPGRGIPARLSKQRDDLVERWPDNVPPEPHWEILETVCTLVQDDLPRAPEESDVIIEMTAAGLELTEHQLAMLKTPEERIQQIKLPKSLADRAKIKRRCRHKNKWTAKLRGHFTGKDSRKWRLRMKKGERRNLELEASGTAKTTARLKSADEPKHTALTPRKKGELLRRARFESTRVRAGGRENRAAEAYKVKEIEDTVWKDKTVRVFEEGLHEGMVGSVTSVRVRPDKTEILNCMTSAGMVFMADARDVRVEKKWADARPVHLNYRVFRKAERLDAAKDLAISLVQVIKPNTMLEDLTVEAAMKEIELRMKPNEDVVLVPPSMAKVLERTRIETLQEAHTPQEREWARRLTAARHVYVIVHRSEHFVLVEAHQADDASWTIEYRDSSKAPNEAHKTAAGTILEHLNIKGPVPPRCNKREQPGGWECGIWAARWLERSLREHRGEGRVEPLSDKAWLTRANEFIMKVKNEAATDAELKAIGKAKAKAKTMAAPRRDLEPKWDSLEQALEAAHACKKCMATLARTKGRRACMGEHFELIRQRGQGARELKELYKNIEDID